MSLCEGGGEGRCGIDLTLSSSIVYSARAADGFSELARVMAQKPNPLERAQPVQPRVGMQMTPWRAIATRNE